MIPTHINPSIPIPSIPIPSLASPQVAHQVGRLEQVWSPKAQPSAYGAPQLEGRCRKPPHSIKSKNQNCTKQEHARLRLRVLVAKSHIWYILIHPDTFWYHVERRVLESCGILRDHVSKYENSNPARHQYRALPLQSIPFPTLQLYKIKKYQKDIWSLNVTHTF